MDLPRFLWEFSQWQLFDDVVGILSITISSTKYKMFYKDWSCNNNCHTCIFSFVDEPIIVLSNLLEAELKVKKNIQNSLLCVNFPTIKLNDINNNSILLN